MNYPKYLHIINLAKTSSAPDTTNTRLGNLPLSDLEKYNHGTKKEDNIVHREKLDSTTYEKCLKLEGNQIDLI